MTAPRPPHHPAAGQWVSRRRWLLAAAAVIGAAVLAGILLTARESGSAGERTHARTAAAQFLTDIEQRRYSIALALVCTEEQTDPTAFVAHWRTQAASGRGITAFTITDITVTGHSGDGSAQARISLRYADGSTDTMRLRLAEYRHHWQPCP
jgi:hypothetical protein